VRGGAAGAILAGAAVIAALPVIGFIGCDAVTRGLCRIMPHALPILEIAPVLVRFDHVASFIVNAVLVPIAS
jgi:hypothetical protein